MMPFLSYINQKIVVNAFLYKHGAMSLSSLSLATFISIFTVNVKIEDSYFGIATTLILLLSLLIFIDSITGIIASRHEGEKIQSGKLLFTFYKFLMSFLFFWILFEFQDKLDLKIAKVKSEYLSTFYKSSKEVLEIITYSVFILLTMREWLSIGENIERRFGKKFYLFTLIEKIFDIVENKLLKWLDGTDLCKTPNKEE